LILSILIYVQIAFGYVSQEYYYYFTAVIGNSENLGLKFDLE